ncbi:hypothetical protein ACMDCR_24485 [Labrys okinawensis]|uniref:hypothetical protein n=1 Tax=Labrys okinawensis TaxID=346911 RepID=UPI0039BC603E
MTTANFDNSYSAIAQMALLSAADRAALVRLFSSNPMEQAGTSSAMPDGRYISKVGTKRILWRRTSRQKPEILSIVDQSHAQA